MMTGTVFAVVAILLIGALGLAGQISSMKGWLSHLLK